MSLKALRRDTFGALVAVLEDGTELKGVSPVRCFPFSSPSEFISLLDETGRDRCLIPSLAKLAPEIAALLEAELRARELMPSITRILSISPGPEPTTWSVMTDKGETRFVLPSEDQIRRLGEGALITDSHGVRYRIVSLRALEPKGRRALFRYL